MTTVATFARKNPDKTALIYGNAEHVESYGQLEARSRRIGHVLRRLGLEFGDNVAVYLANDDRFFDIYWACHRTGLYFTPVNWHLREDETQYIVDNSDSKLPVAHGRFAEIAARVARRAPKVSARLSIASKAPEQRSAR